MITRSELDRMFPNGRPETLEALFDLGPVLVRHYGWTDHDWRHAMGQVHAETGGLTLHPLRENMRFTTAARIEAVYRKRLRMALERDADLRREHRTVSGLAKHLVGKPDLLADVAYGGREGTPFGMGHRYIGRGLSQITHLNNYKAVAAEIRNQPGGYDCPDLVEQPEALERPDMAVRALFADWAIKGLQRFANDDDLENVSSVLNAGSAGKWSIVNGKENRQRGLARAVAVWPTTRTVWKDSSQYAPPVAEKPTLKRGDECDQVRDLQHMLEGLGFSVGDPDGCYGVLTERAVLNAQHENGLPPTGKADPQTVDVLRRTAKTPLPREDMDERELARRGSRTYSEAKSLTLWGRAMKWLGLGTGGTGLAEAVSPGTVTQFISTGPKLAESLTSPHMMRAYAVAFGFGLLVLGWRLTSGGSKIIGWRLDDARKGKHIGR